jgi:hypothetical protein
LKTKKPSPPVRGRGSCNEERGSLSSDSYIPFDCEHFAGQPPKMRSLSAKMAIVQKTALSRSPFANPLQKAGVRAQGLVSWFLLRYVFILLAPSQI